MDNDDKTIDEMLDMAARSTTGDPDEAMLRRGLIGARGIHRKHVATKPRPPFLKLPKLRFIKGGKKRDS